MKKGKHILGISFLFAAGLFLISADHIDAPAVQGGTSDITDFYAFQGENSNNMVFVANVQGLLSPSATAGASFDESVMIEFNIDNDGDFVEDLVIQAVPRNGKMYILGPVAPRETGLSSTLTAESSKDVTSVKITSYGEEAVTTTKRGISAFAGPRDDPFFFDFAQYSAIIAGEASGFNNPGSDTFAGTNVLSVVVEVPKSMIGGSGTINTWVESKRKQ
ncbi:DUF4331 family protein [Salinimicrobium oceani]|uniref:DUF4331 domain-containing protein n=1 Tax=Salinimicrobium oceani TaxID=2722702 RepID=A0ABX1D1P6_9FLAO|nr:DUF4331 family protein [Salinimicrobium oceani]NJW53064.1 DUF4331 domain-containing protein [Salinimicrobium oceani]